MKKSSVNLFKRILLILSSFILLISGVMSTAVYDILDMPSVAMAKSLKETNVSKKIGAKASGTQTKTLMVYMIGSNLESESGIASKDIVEMMKTNNGDDFNIVIQTGGTAHWHQDVISSTENRFKDGEVQRFQVKNGQLDLLQDMGKVNMSSKDTLTDFIKYSKKNFPAEEYILVMWDHGGNIPLCFGVDEVFPNYRLTETQIGDAIAASKVHFDALIFNACEMCSLELFMSLHKNVDYVVAAESLVYGGGRHGTFIDYTDWINYAISTKAATQYYCERILDGYISTLGKSKEKGSMSVIRMDQIEEVYSAYSNYIKQNANILNENPDAFLDYSKVRNSLSSYKGTDAVDLSTLAGRYRNIYSTELQNAVTNAVVRTKSTIDGGNGITVYSPFTVVTRYDKGRKTFEKLEYSEDIIKFYDTIASRVLYETGQTKYAGKWYVEPKTSNNNPSNATETPKPEEPAATPTPAPTVAPSEAPSDGELKLSNPLTVTDMGQYKAIVLSSDDWKKISRVEQTVDYYRAGDKTYVALGVDQQFTTDQQGNIIIDLPKKWLFVNGYIPYSKCIRTAKNDTGIIAKEYIAYAKVNGKKAYISVVTNDAVPSGTIMGYYYDEDDLDNKKIRKFNPEDGIELLSYSYVDTNNLNERVYNKEPILAKDLTVDYKTASFKRGEKINTVFTIYDKKGNKFKTSLYTITKK